MDRPRLTAREQQVFDLIGEGYAGRAIAEKLGMAYDTQRKHRVAILRKLELKSATQLTAAAVSQGDITSESFVDLRSAGRP